MWSGLSGLLDRQAGTENLLGRCVHQGPAIARTDKAIDVAPKLAEQADEGFNPGCGISLVL